MRLIHTMIRVKDLEKSIEFYKNIGMEMVDKRELPGADATLAFMRDPKSGHDVELTFNHDDRDYDLGTGYGHIAFAVESVDDLFADWSSMGIVFSLEPKTMKNGRRIAFAVDPTGYKIELVENPEQA